MEWAHGFRWRWSHRDGFGELRLPLRKDVVPRRKQQGAVEQETAHGINKDSTQRNDSRAQMLRGAALDADVGDQPLRAVSKRVAAERLKRSIGDDWI
jgi:hypothetical protein